MTAVNNVRHWLLAPVLLLMILLGGCDIGNKWGDEKGREEGTLKVISSIVPLSYFVERVGGEHVAVSVMVPPGGNPHSYEPTPQQMVQLGEASVFVKAGSGVEFELDWMPRMMSLNGDLQVCNASEGVELQPIKRHAAAHKAQHYHAQFDPHFWLTPLNGVRIARNVERALVAADPANAAAYKANAGALVAELEMLDKEIRTTFGGVTKKRFLVFHPAWGYYANAYGLEQIAVEEEGKSLTPLQMQRVIQQAAAHRISVIFVSPQSSESQAAAIASEVGAKLGRVDALAYDYQANLRNATRAFVESMQ